MLYDNIRFLREVNDLTQLTVAQYLHVDQGTYSRYERGQVPIPVDILLKLADFYKVSLGYLSDRKEYTSN